MVQAGVMATSRTMQCPTNSRALGAFRHHVSDLWRRTHQKDGMTYERITKIADTWLPKPRILHPWPDGRFAVTIQGGPGARVAPAGIYVGSVLMGIPTSITRRRQG